jgi:hypothetical protein
MRTPSKFKPLQFTVFSAILLHLLTASIRSYCQEQISLYDSQGNAVAYIDTDDGNTIYLWGGRPVAYLYSDNANVNVYSFNGKHLGWYINGILRDHSGDAVGFIKGAVSSIYLKYESYKGYKEYKPYKGHREYTPYKPYFTSNFSNTPLSLFLQMGNDDNGDTRQPRILSAPDPVMETDLDLLLKVNMQKEELFRERTTVVQNTINSIAEVLNRIKSFDSNYYSQQASYLRNFVVKINTTPIDYSDINQFNGVINSLTNYLSSLRQSLLNFEATKPIASQKETETAPSNDEDAHRPGEYIKALDYAPIYDIPDMIKGKKIYQVPENIKLEIIQKVRPNYYKVRVGNIVGYIWVGLISKSE